jgi:hypothetical protein
MADNNDMMAMVRRFAGADPATEDAVLEMCYSAAVAWFEEAGVPTNPTNDLWKFWVCNLAAWMYDNRGNAEASAAIPIYIVTSVHQLRKRVPPNTGSAGTNDGTAAGENPATGNAGANDGAGSAAGDTGTSTGGDG